MNIQSLWKKIIRLTRIRFAPAFLLTAVLCASATAQTDGRKVYNENLRVRMDDQEKVKEREIGVDYGGWFDFTVFNYTDDGDQVHVLRQYELRLWGSANIHNVHKFYVRARMGFDDWNRGTNPDLNENDEFNHPKIERLWYQFDLGQMLSSVGSKRSPFGLKVKVGREFVAFGTGLALATPLDMVRLDFSVGDWELMAMLGKTFRDSTSIDNSWPVWEKQKRRFWGMQLKYQGFAHHEPFAYIIRSNDKTDPIDRGPLLRQSFDYEPNYLGAGSTGVLFSPNLQYSTELVWEWGKEYSNLALAGMHNRDDICAIAFDAALRYDFPVQMSPYAEVEYMFASGDEDRIANTSDTIGGNLLGSTDHAFNGFGYRNTGLAFAPDLSNLHIYSIGAGFRPLEKIQLFKKMEIGTTVFFYQKVEAEGPISDGAGRVSNPWAGWEWDVFCDWRVTSDLSWTARYGMFQPGSSFPDDTNPKFFFYTGISFNF